MESVVVTSEQTVVATAQDLKYERIIVSDTETAVVNVNDSIIVLSGVMGPPGLSGINKISDADDIDKTDLADGAMLVYKELTTKWTATKVILGQVLEAGEY